jgi:hypothetical protein
VSYHVPGFPEAKGFAPDEREVVALIRSYSLSLNGEKDQGYPIPAAPTPVSNCCNMTPKCIRWRGAACAQSYRLERQEEGQNNWQTVSAQVHDNVDSGGTLFNDYSAESCKRYIYRVQSQSDQGATNNEWLYLGPF